MKKIITVIGARPQFIKAAPVSKALAAVGIHEVLVHSGQHYDTNMSDIFWEELGIPLVSHHLEVGSGSHAKQTAEIMVKFENILLAKEKDVEAVLVYGDTNTTLAVALVTSKLNIPLIHVEAGLRSFNRSMPEEVNRILTDKVSSLLFCSSQPAATQLVVEGIGKGVHVVGDIMQDVFNIFKDKKGQIELPERFALFTLHRQENTKNVEQVNDIIQCLSELSYDIIWPIHPRIKAWIKELKVPHNVKIIDPIGYGDMVYACMHAECILTDSGGLQKEAYWANKPCVTFRKDTEWTETLENGWNQLFDPMTESLAKILENKPKQWPHLYGEGQAACRIAQIIKNFN